MEEEGDTAGEDEKTPEGSGSSNPYEGQYVINGVLTDTLPSDLKEYGGIMTDPEGNPVISLAKVYDRLSEELAPYSTHGMMERYSSTKDKAERDAMKIVISKSKGTSTLVDVNTEMDKLVRSLAGEEVEESSYDLSDGIIEITGAQLGDEYIEIDMGNQVLSYYVNGEIEQRFPIVTGMMTKSRATPTGLYKVYNKRYHTILHGYDYETFVNYWLGVHGGVGIHDATWRNTFGGDIYVNSGSHGCINCPKDEMEKLYASVQTGVPVILYY